MLYNEDGPLLFFLFLMHNGFFFIRLSTKLEIMSGAKKKREKTDIVDGSPKEKQDYVL